MGALMMLNEPELAEQAVKLMENVESKRNEILNRIEGHPTKGIQDALAGLIRGAKGLPPPDDDGDEDVCEEDD